MRLLVKPIALELPVSFLSFDFFFRILGNLEQKIFYRAPNNWCNSVICSYKRGVFLSLLFLNFSQRNSQGTT